MEILENHPLKNYSSMKIGGNAKYFSVIESPDEVALLHDFAESNNLPITVIGRGTNTIFKEGNLNRTFGLMNIKGIHLVNDFPESCQVEAMAGETWDDFVDWAVERELSGIEALSAIPGTVGAAPVQNIGAYGSELSDVFVNVRAYDLENKEFVILGLRDCDFGYRDSFFKKFPNKFVIISVTLELSKKKPEIPKYKDVQLHFLGRKTKPSLKAIRKAIIDIREKKLPNPDRIPNCGSFFKNPIIANEQAIQILQRFPEMPHYKVDEDNIKLYAGWMIEQIGFKGKVFENIAIYENNSLVLINNGKATLKELEQAKKKILSKIKDNFKIELEMEPQILG